MRTSGIGKFLINKPVAVSAFKAIIRASWQQFVQTVKVNIWEMENNERERKEKYRNKKRI